MSFLQGHQESLWPCKKLRADNGFHYGENSRYTKQTMNRLNVNRIVAHLPKPALHDLQRAEDILTRNGATKIILYGSAARGEYKAGSDLDLCVDGLQGIKYYLAVGECLREIESPVSVVPLPEVHGYFRQRILQEGKILYER